MNNDITIETKGYSLTYIGDYALMFNTAALIEIVADNLADACVAMILNLYKNNML